MQEAGAGLVLLCHPGPEAVVTASLDKETDAEIKNKSAAGATAECAGAAWIEGWHAAQPPIQENKKQNRTTKRSGQLCQ